MSDIRDFIKLSYTGTYTVTEDDLAAAFSVIGAERGEPESVLMSKRNYDLLRLGYDPDGKFARKYRRRQAKRRIKHAGKAWV